MNETRDPFVPIGFAAHVAGRSHRTVRTWAARGVVRKATAGSGVKVHIADVVKESKARERRPSLTDRKSG